MTNAQSRFANATAPPLPFIRYGQRSHQDDNWTWHPAKEAFINRFGTECRVRAGKPQSLTYEDWAHQW